jgi:hypothetical protein
MLTINEITEIFFLCDDFTKEFDKSYKKHILQTNNGKKTRNKPCKLSHSEVMTILISFHLGGYRNLKHYYLFYVSQHLNKEFPELVSYNHFVELQQQVAFPLVLFLKLCRMGQCTGISFVDSTPNTMKQNLKFLTLSLLLGLFLSSCSSNSNQRVDNSKTATIISKVKKPLPDNKSMFTKVHSLKKKDNTFIGDVYVKFINDSVFTDLYVVNSKDTLYTIKKNIFTNTKGKNLDVPNDNFYGYLFALKKTDSFTLSFLTNKGLDSSDDIIIEWNYQNNVLEFKILP